MNYYPGIERDALDYIEIQKRQRHLMQEFERNNPSLFSRMMKAGLLAVLGAIGAGILDQDPIKGAATGALASIMLPPKRRPMPMQPMAPPYRLKMGSTVQELFGPEAPGKKPMHKADKMTRLGQTQKNLPMKHADPNKPAVTKGMFE